MSENLQDMLEQKHGKKSTKSTIQNVDMNEYYEQKKAEMAKAENVEEEKQIATMKPQKSRFEPLPKKIKLPSLGISLDPKYINDNSVYIRRITTKEEDMIYSFINQIESTQDPNAIANFVQDMILMIDNVIDSCLKTNIPFSEFMTCDRELLFNFIVGLGYGENQKLEYICPKCGTKYNVEFNMIDDLNIKYFDTNLTPYPLKFELSSFDNITIEIRGLKTGEMKIIFDKNASQTDLFKTVLLKIYETDSLNTIKEDELTDLFDSLNDADRKKIKQYIEDVGTYGCGAKFTFNKQVCNTEGCELKNKDVELSYSLNYLLYNVINLKNV